MKIKNYATAVNKIEKCKSIKACNKLEASFDMLHDEDFFNMTEYLTLDGLLNEKRNEIEESN
jgi:hypothetical protein